MTDLRVLLFVFIPQGLATFFIGMALFGLKADARRILIFGMIYGLVDYIGKNLFMPLGLDLIGNLISITYMILVLRYIFKIRIGLSVAAAIVGFVLQMAVALITIPILDLLKIDYIALYKSGQPWKLVLLGTLNILPLYILALFQIVKPFSIINFSRRNGTYL